jgi:uncharacterized membrane protein
MSRRAKDRAPGREDNLSSSTKDNLEILARLAESEDAAISGMQLMIERVSTFFGSPAYFAFAVCFIVLWVLINAWGAHRGWPHVDAPPFFWLQGIVSSNALLLTVAVLIRQTRMLQAAEHRAHLDLQINLLTEQKVTKILRIVDELGRELPEQRSRPDEEEVSDLTKPADAHAILHAIKKKSDER